MRRALQNILFTTVAALPTANGHADVLLTPYLGTTFESVREDAGLNYGGALGFTGGSPVGFELDLGYSPDGLATGLHASIATLMANLLVGGLRGETRPYVAFGGGLIRARFDAPGVIPVTRNDQWGLNAGAGVIAFATNHIGVRGDFRYFRSLTGEDQELDVQPFWRGVAGVTLRF